MARFAAALISAAWRWLLLHVGGWSLLILALLWSAHWAVVSGLTAVVGSLAERWQLLHLLVIGGLILGWRTGGRRGPWLWLPAWIVLGAPLVFLASGSLVDDLGQLALRAAGRSADWLQWLLSDSRADALPADVGLALAWAGFSNGVQLYADDIRTWSSALDGGRSEFRSGAVAFVSGAVLWICALWAGGTMRRFRSPLLALFPAGALLSAILALAYEDGPIWLAAFLTFVLTLMAVETQSRNEARWDIRRLDFPEDMRLDFSMTAAGLVTVVVFAAYGLPMLNLRSTFRQLAGLERSQPAGSGAELGESLGIALPTAPPPFTESFPEGGLPREHLIGAGPELARTTVMTVRIIGQGLPEGQRYFWRGLTYDRYTGAGWSTGPTQVIRYPAGTRLPYEELAISRVVRQEYDMLLRAGELAYAAGDVLAMDGPFEVSWRGPIGDVLDPFGVRRPDDVYTVDSLAPLMVEETLQASVAAYPDWIEDRYLGLPDSVPERVRALAADLTAPAGTPYDRARRIEAFLRSFPYTLDVPLPPAGHDLVDYFVFDLQRGYCDYYASAMVVMLRAVGIPARLATGYAAGAFDPQERLFVVTALDAHSWPEVYFAGIGWVPFEPTAGRAALMPLVESGLPAEAVELPEMALRSRGWPGSVLVWLAAVVVFSCSIVMLWLAVDTWRLWRASPEDCFVRLVQGCYAVSRRLQVALPPQATPLELSHALVAHFAPLFVSLAWLPGRAERIAVLIEPHVRGCYSPDRPSEEEKRDAIREWVWLRVKMAVVGLSRRK